MNAPELVVHGLDLSYFTGKLEAYLRAKGLAYRLEEMTIGSFRALARKTGIAQMPQLELPSGALLTDTSRIIDQLELERPAPSITPRDPVARFAAALLEDFGDEHLWRPALYFRWAFDDDARLMSARLARGMLRDVPAPFWIRRRIILARQRSRYLRQDGVTPRTAPAIETLYRATLDAMNRALASRPFLMGERPTRADIGFFGSMFRHFASDPTPAALMRARAPRVLAWTARLWAITPADVAHAPEPIGIPDDLTPFADMIAGDFLPYLAANAEAARAGASRTRFVSGGAHFVVPANPYRAERLARIRDRLRALDANEQAAIEVWLGPGAIALIEKAPDPTPRAAAIVDREGRPLRVRVPPDRGSISV
jgi:glutathione S-transferase